MADFTVAIQHAPASAERREWVRAMSEQLRQENPGVALHVIEDVHQEGCWPTYRRALEAAGETSHHLVLQDDIGLCKDFLKSVQAAMHALPGNLLSFYTNSVYVENARARGDAWLERPNVCGPALLWPCNWINEFLLWHDSHVSPLCPWDTVRVTFWLTRQARRAFSTVPSLVEHLGSEASLLGLDSPTKVASWFIGENQSGTSIDWSRGVKSPLVDPKPLPDEWWQFCRDDAPGADRACNR